MAIEPLDVRARELWKAVAITASEHDHANIATEKADYVTTAFLKKFYPTNIDAKKMIENMNKVYNN